VKKITIGQQQMIARNNKSDFQDKPDNTWIFQLMRTTNKRIIKIERSCIDVTWSERIVASYVLGRGHQLIFGAAAIACD
jgi:hypothetical protein